jgi:hypothetical protein
MRQGWFETFHKVDTGSTGGGDLAAATQPATELACSGQIGPLIEP